MTFVESTAHTVALSNSFIPEPTAGLRVRTKNHKITITLLNQLPMLNGSLEEATGTGSTIAGKLSAALSCLPRLANVLALLQ